MYVLMSPRTFVWTPTHELIHCVSDLLHPPPAIDGKPILYDDWNGWFETVAYFGISLGVATGTFFAAVVLSCQDNSRADKVTEP